MVHLHGRGWHGVEVLARAGFNGSPGKNLVPWGSASWLLFYLENCLFIMGVACDPLAKSKVKLQTMNQEAYIYQEGVQGFQR